MPVRGLHIIFSKLFVHVCMYNVVERYIKHMYSTQCILSLYENIYMYMYVRTLALDSCSARSSGTSDGGLREEREVSLADSHA